MRLWFVHKEPGIRTILDKVMPGAVWTYPEPRHLKKATADSKAAQILGQVLAYLAGVPEGINKVSVRAVKDAAGLGKDGAAMRTFTRAMGLLSLSEHGWTTEGRSLVRGAEVYGFSDHG
jgi:hypothetical protein